MAGRVDIQNVQRRGRTDAEALALAHGEVEYAVVMAHDFTG